MAFRTYSDGATSKGGQTLNYLLGATASNAGRSPVYGTVAHTVAHTISSESVMCSTTYLNHGHVQPIV